MAARSVRTIALVDDEQSVLFALRLLLSALGYAAIEFSDPAKAVSDIKERSDIDLIICDLRMPSLSGIEVLDRCMVEFPSVPFVLMSAHASDDEVHLATTKGAVGFLAKPFTPDELKSLIKQVESLPW